MKKTLPHWIAIGTLSFALVGVLSFFLMGHSEKMADGRTAVHLSAQDRQRVLTEMRTLLESTQQIVKGLAENDFEAVEKAALNVGTQAITTADMKLAPQLPSGFKKLGFGTHEAFDEVAKMAQEKKPSQEIQLKLVNTMNNCVACHASFRLPEFSPGTTP